MLAEVGIILIGLAFAVALYAAFATFWAVWRDNARWAQSSSNGIYAVLWLLGSALLLLLVAFLTDQFQVRYVASHSDRALPVYLKFSAVWAGQEGSLLLWAFLQALFAVLVMRRESRHASPLTAWTLVILNLITSFFVGVTFFLSNPFVQTATIPVDGRGLNPLLRHPGMIFHPPAMYLGYVGLAVPFAFAVAALIVRRVDDWPGIARPWAVAAWLLLGIGLLLGMRWAYDVLGWGGYWGWDPVENAGLMPWLTATALLHGMVMQQERAGFRWWNLILVVLSFVLVLFGTFVTRSGWVLSVHAFARSNLGPYFLTAIGLTVMGPLILMIRRRSILAASQPLERLISRGGMFLLTVIVLLVITASVFIGSMMPTLTRIEAGPAWFDRVTGPQFGLLLLLMGVCPVLGRAAKALKRLRAGAIQRAILALVGTGLAISGAALAGFTQPLSLVGFALVGLAGTTTAMACAGDALARSRRLDEGLASALGHLFARNRRKYGGYLVHVGVILMALGILGTRMYPLETKAVFTQGESVTVAGYILTYEDFDQTWVGNRLSTETAFSVRRDERVLATLSPQLDQYASYGGQTVSVPALHVSLREDLYLVLAGWGHQGETAMLKIFVNPLAVFLWVGGLVFLGGGTVALWPVTQPAHLSAPEVRRRRVKTFVWVSVGALVLIAAVLMMWRTGTVGG